MTAAGGAHSSYLKCESIKLLSSIYKHDTSNTEELSEKARRSMKECCSKVGSTLNDAQGDKSLQKAKHRDEVVVATKHFINYLKAQNEGILTDSDITRLQESLQVVGSKCKSAGMKNMISQVAETASSLARRDSDREQTPTKRLQTPKTKKTSKKHKKSKK
jgi:hypothetical protein